MAAPCRISNFCTATAVAMVVVVIELLTISWIQWRYMDVSPLSAAAKVMAGGALVLGAGVLIGSSRAEPTHFSSWPPL